MADDDEILDLERARAERSALLLAEASVPFDEGSESLLKRLSASLVDELRPILRRPATVAGLMNPFGFAPGSRVMLLQSVVDVCGARLEASMTAGSIKDLGTPETIRAIEARLRPSSVQAKRGSWGPIKAGMLLADVRKLVRFAYGTCDVDIGLKQREWSAEPKRDIDYRVRTREEYVRTAHVLGSFAGILKEGGYVRGESLARDAGMLALNAYAHARRSEICCANVGDLRRRRSGDRDILSCALRPTKHGRERIVLIRDPRVIALLKPLLSADPASPLFRTVAGRLGYAAVGEVLLRTGELAAGQPGGANIMRRSATLRRDGRKALSGLTLGHSSEKTANEEYTPSRSPLGHRLLREANAKSAQAAKKVRDSAS